jgi:hypothetical protein
MTLLGAIITMALIGLAAWMLTTWVPMDPRIKQVITALAVIIVVILAILVIMGLLGFPAILNRPISR